MKYIAENEFSLKKTAVSLGKFDGLHRGHRLLLDEILRTADKSDMESVVFTFSMHPDFILNKAIKNYIYTEKEKMFLLEEMGMDTMVSYPFNKQASQMTAKNFIVQVLVGKLDAKKIVVGSDFRFGKDRQGDVELLKQYADKYGYELVVKEKLQDEEQVISSTRIRKLIGKGDIEKANTLLGSPFFVMGEVVKGNQLGRTLSMPTANLAPEETKLLPPAGVYATLTKLNGKMYPGVTNVGTKPTVGEGYQTGVETNMIYEGEDFYGETIQVYFLKYIREEKKFDGLQSLLEQMQKDKETAMNYINSLNV